MILQDDITINSLQHYVFCPHSWGLMFVCGEWNENFKTIGGHIFHERVHDAFADESRSGKLAVRAMPVFDEDTGLVGEADLVEFCSSEKGVVLSDGRKYLPTVVEYKSGRYDDPKQIRDADKMQLTAQMVCVESMFGCAVKGCVYYGATNRRLKFTEYETYKPQLYAVLQIMREYLKEGFVPAKKAETGCALCSLKDICLPKCADKDTFEIIDKRWKDFCREKIT